MLKLGPGARSQKVRRNFYLNSSSNFLNWRAMKSVGAGMIVLFTVACGPDAQSDRSGSAGRDSTSVHGWENAPADSQFARFLSASIATRENTRGLFDSVYTNEGRKPTPGEIEDVSGPCPQEFMEERWLADYRLLSVTTRGDSGRAAAEITTVAREVEDGAEWLATILVSQDTAHWRLIRSDVTQGLWMVCGESMEGFGLFRMPPSHLRWSKNGSAVKARAAVDSIRRARGLALVR